MKCTHCQEREATIHIKNNINGVTQSFDLCPVCAQELENEGKLQINMNLFGGSDNGFFSWDPFADSFGNMQAFWQNFFGAPAKQTAAPTLEKSKVCPSCGTTWAEFRRTGKLGCADCYDTFSEALPNLIGKIHGAEAHQGKVPKQNESHLKEKSEKEKLQSALQKAIAEEAYEEAARLRDEIHALEEKEKNDPDKGADEA